MIELRCSGTMHGRLEDELIEVKCRRRSCGSAPGVVILHFFNVHTGELMYTKQFAEPRKPEV